MSTVSYNSQNLKIDGRSIWLVSGTIDYARTPAELWQRRIQAARQAGLNCIATHVFWNVHEPKPNHFYFEGDANLRRFVQLIGEEGMHCILRPGPCAASSWDFGGLPAWLHRVDNIELRQANAAFQKACARYFGAVMNQVQDLQVTSPNSSTFEVVGERGGPIVLVQVEQAWCCLNPQQAEDYHNELVRYLRENGCAVPIIDCNLLWEKSDVSVACWSGRTLASDLRQLRIVQPDAPRIAIEYQTGRLDHWGSAHEKEDAACHLYRLAAILAVGGQPNLHMFHGGTNFGFYGGRTVGSQFSYATTSCDWDAPLSEGGGRTAKYLTTKRICNFASQFANVFANLKPDSQPTVIAPDESDHSLSVVHQHGSQGDVVFLLKSQKDKTPSAAIMLPNGQTLEVYFDDDRVAWLLLEANLTNGVTLSYTNLRPWAFIKNRLLVLFGPAGCDAVVCINDAAIRLKVPTGSTPFVDQADGLTFAVLNSRQIDAAYLCADGVAIGSAGLDDEGQPQPLAGWPKITTVHINGAITSQGFKSASNAKPPTLEVWHQAEVAALLEGTSAAYKPIDGPASVERLKCDYGYCWYRIKIKQGQNASGKMLVPQSGDRLHVYKEGKLIQLLGHGPDAEYQPTQLNLSGDRVILADNLGRFGNSWLQGEPKGLFGHFYRVKQVRLGKPKVMAGQAPDLFELGGYFHFARRGDQPPADSLLWHVKPEGRKPMVLDINNLPGRAMLIINDQPIGAYDQQQSCGYARFLLEPGKQITSGNNRMKLALFGRYDKAVKLDKYLQLYQTTGCPTAKASWSFALWKPPKNSDFKPISNNLSAQPCWYRATFIATQTEVPLWLELRNMSKGQIYINGHNAGRYFIATRTRKAIGPQSRYYLPEPWLRINEPNELLLFDEHGKQPTSCRLVYDAAGPYGK